MRVKNSEVFQEATGSLHQDEVSELSALGNDRIIDVDVPIAEGDVVVEVLEGGEVVANAESTPAEDVPAELSATEASIEEPVAPPSKKKNKGENKPPKNTFSTVKRMFSKNKFTEDID